MTEVIGAGNGLKYHQLLLEAIRAHDPVQARTVMHRHLRTIYSVSGPCIPRELNQEMWLDPGHWR